MANPFNTAPRSTMNNQNIAYFRNLYKSISQSNNPYQALMNLAGNNPQMQPILNAMRNGNSLESVFKNMCKQRGIDPQAFMNQIIR